MEEWGYINPLDAGSYDRWENAQKARSFLGATEVETDSDSGRVDLKTKGAIKPTKAAPPDGTYPVPLGDWRWANGGAGLVVLILHPRAGETWTFNSIFDDDERAQAILAWLESKRDSSRTDAHITRDAVDETISAYSDLADAFGSRIYDIDQGGSHGTVSLEGESTTGGSVDGVQFMQLNFSIDAGTPVYNALTSLMDGETISTQTTLPIVPSPVGDHENRLIAERLELPNLELTSERGFLESTDSNGVMRTVGAGELIDWDGLRTPGVSGVTYKELPLLKASHTRIHVDTTGTTDAVIRLRPGAEIVPFQGETMSFSIHNHRENGDVVIADRDGNEEVRLIPDDEQGFIITWLEDGGTEIVSDGLVRRRFEVAAVIPTDASVRDLGDINSMLSGSNDYFPMPLGLATDRSIDHQDTDAFARNGTDTITLDDPLSDINLAWQTVTLERECNVRIVAGARIGRSNASLPWGWGLTLIRNGVEDEDTFDSQRGQSSYDTSWTRMLAEYDDAPAGDRFTVMLKVPTSVGQNNQVWFERIHVRMIAEYHMELNYS